MEENTTEVSVKRESHVRGAGAQKKLVIFALFLQCVLTLAYTSYSERTFHFSFKILDYGREVI